MIDAEVGVIGCGITGATIGAHLRRCGWNVVFIDDGRVESGTSASGGLIKPSKLTGLPPEMNTDVLRLLDPLFGLTRETFVLRPSLELLKMEIHRVSLDAVRALARRTGKVTAIRRGGVNEIEYVSEAGPEVLRCTYVILAGGFWCFELFPEVFPPGTLTAKKGISFHFAGTIAKPFVKTWAPYKQITAHEVERGGKTETWAGDGTALIPENWTEAREGEILTRIQKELKRPPPVARFRGLRPFHIRKDKPCFLEEVYPGVWIVTGGGKFGTIAAAWAARKLENSLI